MPEKPRDVPADLITGDLGAKKNVKEWVRNGESTAEAKQLALALQAKIEALKTSTNLQLLSDYKDIFDEKILTQGSYDSAPVTVDQNYKDKGVLAVLEDKCPLLSASFKAYPDLRYLAYGTATRQVPDVDVLPLGSTVSMTDGLVTLKRPGKPDASFLLFPWDARAAVEAKYAELKMASVPAAPAPAAEGHTPAGTPREEAKAPAPAKDPSAAPEKKEDDHDKEWARIQSEYEQALAKYPELQVRTFEASPRNALKGNLLTRDAETGRDPMPNYGNYGKTIEITNVLTEKVTQVMIVPPSSFASYNTDQSIHIWIDGKKLAPDTSYTDSNGKKSSYRSKTIPEIVASQAERALTDSTPAELRREMRRLNDRPAGIQAIYLNKVATDFLETARNYAALPPVQQRTVETYLGVLPDLDKWHDELANDTHLTPKDMQLLADAAQSLGQLALLLPRLPHKEVPAARPEAPVAAPAPTPAPSPEVSPVAASKEAGSVDPAQLASYKESLKILTDVGVVTAYLGQEKNPEKRALLQARLSELQQSEK